ncbi:malectin domain-containing carbohydrate-binding protein [Haladaptatus caseinilyticus]|uniref:malectin domain-containing carbohydrate-binding protein n=1 Tax=Haladaptatus caseinilyticus TaxID=2993314 RepID=UPI00224A5444|nr:malectin domain-containing carbohydrate-binding protein [Haladaptatus caseinilyticus]
MSGTSSGGFVHGALIGGGVVFFVAGMIIVSGIPGVLGPSVGGMSNETTVVSTTDVQTSTQTTQTSTEQVTTESPETTQSRQTTPATTTRTTTTTAPKATAVYRVNVGGKRLSMADGGPDWTRDTERRPSRFGNARKSGSHTNSTNDRIARTAAVPSGTPEAVFQSRRYDADNAGSLADNTEMQYRFPVEKGTYEVRLYFVESYFGNSEWNDYDEKGPRTFDVEIEDKRVLNNYDMYEELGHDKGTMKSFTVKPKDGTIDVRFLHEEEDPMLSGIEIVRVDGKKNGKSKDRQRNGDLGNSDGFNANGWSEISLSEPTLTLSDATLDTPSLGVRSAVTQKFQMSPTFRPT